MATSLAKLRNLPDDTNVWCGHEYTLSNLKFAITVEGENEALRSRLATVTSARQQNQPTVPSLLSTEKATNPFLRWNSPALQSVANSQDPITVFAHIRKLKDNF